MLREQRMISIDHGSSKDIHSWMRLVRKVSGSFPGLETEEALAEHRRTVLDFMSRQHFAEELFRFMLPPMYADRPITVTTYREGMPEGIAARAFYQKPGFVPGKLTVEFGSEVQELVLDVRAWQTY